MATASYDGTARLWDAKTGREQRTLEKHAGLVFSVSFSPDGKRLATANSDKTVRIWEVETGRELQVLKGHSEMVLAVAFSPRGNCLASGGMDMKVALWRTWPWRKEDHPGGAGLARDDRSERFKRDYWKKRQEARDSTLARTVESRRRKEAETLEPCAENLRAIHAGLLQWRREHDDQLPDWLSNLVPKYVRADALLCPNDPTRSSLYNLDPNTSCNYGFEFPDVVANLETARGKTWREWKQKDLKTYGDMVPTVRCLHHGERILSLSYGGYLYLSPLIWTSEARDPYPPKVEEPLLTRPGVLIFQQGASPSPGYGGCRDAHILNYRPDLNTGACGHCEVGSWRNKPRKDRKKFLIRFDLSDAPPSYAVGRAEIRLYLFGERKYNRRNNQSLYVARLLRSWGEGQRTYLDGEAAQQGDVTYNSARHGRETWEKPGAMGVTDVADAESSATVGEHWPGWVTLDVTESVRYFLANPGKNYGWKISPDPIRGVSDSEIEYVEGSYVYKSSEAPELHLRPMLLLIPEGFAGGTSEVLPFSRAIRPLD